MRWQAAACGRGKGMMPERGRCFGASPPHPLPRRPQPLTAPSSLPLFRRPPPLPPTRRHLFLRELQGADDDHVLPRAVLEAELDAALDFGHSRELRVVNEGLALVAAGGRRPSAHVPAATKASGTKAPGTKSPRKARRQRVRAVRRGGASQGAQGQRAGGSGAGRAVATGSRTTPHLPNSQRELRRRLTHSLEALDDGCLSAPIRAHDHCQRLAGRARRARWKDGWGRRALAKGSAEERRGARSQTARPHESEHGRAGRERGERRGAGA